MLEPGACWSPGQRSLLVCRRLIPALSLCLEAEWWDPSRWCGAAGGAEAELGIHSAGLRGNHLTPLVSAAAAARDTPGSADLGPRSASVCETQSTDLEPPRLRPPRPGWPEQISAQCGSFLVHSHGPEQGQTRGPRRFRLVVSVAVFLLSQRKGAPLWVVGPPEARLLWALAVHDGGSPARFAAVQAAGACSRCGLTDLCPVCEWP